MSYVDPPEIRSGRNRQLPYRTPRRIRAHGQWSTLRPDATVAVRGQSSTERPRGVAGIIVIGNSLLALRRLRRPGFESGDRSAPTSRADLRTSRTTAQKLSPPLASQLN
ncbi:MAG: hypothetical protein KF868_17765 [Acidobacteria bacterium]|nr:hypothetical protein [Acidobacteriota bacterium]MCW5971232.1 hypothetical protein [Blastocatellales bacterium]